MPAVSVERVQLASPDETSDRRLLLLLAGLFFVSGACGLVYQQAIADVVPASRVLLTGVRFVLAFAALIVPATLMGASLPLVMKSSLTRSARLGERVSVLYGANTTGAIFGTVVAGFVLIGRYGIISSFRLAALANVVVGVVAIVASRRAVNSPEPDLVKFRRPHGAETSRDRVQRTSCSGRRCQTRTRRRCGIDIPTSGCSGSRKVPRPR